MGNPLEWELPVEELYLLQIWVEEWHVFRMSDLFSFFFPFKIQVAEAQSDVHFYMKVFY